jgi:hypothetical protein
MTGIAEHLEKLRRADEAGRIYAAQDIGYANATEGVTPLLDRLAVESSRKVREAIFGALESIDDESVIAGATGLLASEDAFIRNQAVELLKRRGPRATLVLARVFPDMNGDQRKLVLDVLAGLDGPGASAIYRLALSDSDPNVAITAIENLARMGKTEFRERIEELCATGSPMLFGVCLEALARIGDARSVERIGGLALAARVPAFLQPSYLRLLGAHGYAAELAAAAEQLELGGAHAQAALLDAVVLLRQRNPPAPDCGALKQVLRRIASQGAAPLRRHALRLLGGGETGEAPDA